MFEMLSNLLSNIAQLHAYMHRAQTVGDDPTLHFTPSNLSKSTQRTLCGGRLQSLGAVYGSASGLVGMYACVPTTIHTSQVMFVEREKVR